MKDLSYDGVLISGEGHTSDSSHHTIYAQCMRHIMNENIKDARHWFFDNNGNMTRHPVRLPVDFTRDQFIPFLAYMAITKTRHSPTENYYKKIKKNYGFFFNSHESNGTPKPWWNRDFLDPAMIGLFNRATGGSRALAILGDFHILLTILFKMLLRPNSHSDENIILYLVSSFLNRPSWFSKISWLAYFHLRAVPWQVGVDDFWNREGSYYPENFYWTVKAINRLLGNNSGRINGAHHEFLYFNGKSLETLRHDNKFSFVVDQLVFKKEKQKYFKVRYAWEMHDGHNIGVDFIRKCRFTSGGFEVGVAPLKISHSPIVGRLYHLRKKILAWLKLGW